MLIKIFGMLLKIILFLLMSSGALIHSDNEIQGAENDKVNHHEVDNSPEDRLGTQAIQIPDFGNEVSDNAEFTFDVDYSSSGAENVDFSTSSHNVEEIQDKPIDEARSNETATTDNEYVSTVSQNNTVVPSNSDRAVSVELMEEATRHAQNAAEKSHDSTNQLHEYGPATPEITDDCASGRSTVETVLPEEKKLDDETGALGSGVSVEMKDDIETLKREGEMPSFDEWKKTKMLEMHSEKVKQVEVPVQQPQNGRKAYHKTNYASSACGAKVLVANPEAQSTSSILTENRDQYMINPCSAKKWFVVELCEPVHIHTIELGNLELFSSTPEKFVVSVSERYPSKEWHMAAALNARDERSVQNFSLRTDAIYVKYIKVEIVSHYGREHYCPLTILRVFGTAVEDDDPDDDVLSLSVTDTDDGLDQTTSDTGMLSRTLLTAATDTIKSIVKSVLTAGVSNQQTAEQKTTDVTNTNGEDKTRSSPAGNNSSPNAATQPERVVTKSTSRVRTSWAVPAAPARNSVWAYVAEHCNYCDTNPFPRGCWFGLGTVCGYVRVLHFIYPTSCVRQISHIPATSREQLHEDVLHASPDGDIGCSHETVNAGIASGAKQPLAADNKADVFATANSKDTVEVHNERVAKSEFNVEKDAAEKQVADNKTVVPAEHQGGGGSGVDEAMMGDMMLEASADDLMEMEAGGVYQNSGGGGGEDEGEQVVAKLNAGKKETIYMKLRNRIKAMELNLSLSSRYLEELSQRYRRQMDEMYVSLNKTITKLSNTSKSAERRDEKQQEQLIVLQQMLEQLTTQMATVTRNADTSYSLMLEQHLLLICLQAVVFIVLVAWVKKTQNRSHKMLQDVAMAQRAASATVVAPCSCHTTCHGDRTRLPGDDREPPAAAFSTVTRADGGEIKKDFSIIAPNQPIFLWDSSSVCLPPGDVGMSLALSKKKRRRNRQSLDAALNMSASSMSLPEHPPCFSEPPSPVEVSRSYGDASMRGRNATFTCGTPVGSRASSPCSSVVSSLSDVSMSSDLDLSITANRVSTNGHALGSKSHLPGKKPGSATGNGGVMSPVNGSSSNGYHLPVDKLGWLERDLKNSRDALLHNKSPTAPSRRQPMESTPKRPTGGGARKVLSSANSPASPTGSARGGDWRDTLLVPRCNGSKNVCHRDDGVSSISKGHSPVLKTVGSMELI